MKYLSLFSGIGAYEVAIHKKYKDAICIGYSEIDDEAVKVYKNHFATHENLGDIKDIDSKCIFKQYIKYKGCDLVTAGELWQTKLLDDEHSISDDKSKIICYLLNILHVLVDLNPDLKIIIESNEYINTIWRDRITNSLCKTLNKKVNCNLIDSKNIVLQQRKRYYWTVHEIPIYNGNRIQNWSNVLEPVDTITNQYNLLAMSKIIDNNRKIYIDFYDTNNNCCSMKAKNIKNSPFFMFVLTKKKKQNRARFASHSDTGNKHTILYPYPIGNAKTIGTDDNILIDRRFNKDSNIFVIRYYSQQEMHLLFGFPCNYIVPDLYSMQIHNKLFGTSTIVPVISYILSFF